MLKIAVELEPEWVSTLRPLDPRPLGSFFKELATLELYRRRLISSGKAAELLNMDRLEFIHYASRQGIAYLDLSEDEFVAEVELLGQLP